MIGTVGDALDNALMESQIGLYKKELIKPRKPWHGLSDVELATAEWVDWFNNQRLHTAIGDNPPHEHETNYYAQHQPQPATGVLLLSVLVTRLAISCCLPQPRRWWRSSPPPRRLFGDR